MRVAGSDGVALDQAFDKTRIAGNVLKLATKIDRCSQWNNSLNLLLWKYFAALASDRASLLDIGPH